MGISVWVVLQLRWVLGESWSRVVWIGLDIVWFAWRNLNWSFWRCLVWDKLSCGFPSNYSLWWTRVSQWKKKIGTKGENSWVWVRSGFLGYLVVVAVSSSLVCLVKLDFWGNGWYRRNWLVGMGWTSQMDRMDSMGQWRYRGKESNRGISGATSLDI